MRCQIFRQIVQKFRRHTDVCRGIFVFLYKMTENMQADVVLSRKAVFVRCCLKACRRSKHFVTVHADLVYIAVGLFFYTVGVCVLNIRSDIVCAVAYI